MYFKAFIRVLLLLMFAAQLTGQNSNELLYRRALEDFSQGRYLRAREQLNLLIDSDGVSGALGDYLVLRALSIAYGAESSDAFHMARRDLLLAAQRPPAGEYVRNLPYWKSEIELLTGEQTTALEVLSTWLDSEDAPAPSEDMFVNAWRRRFDLEREILGLSSAAGSLSAGLNRLWNDESLVSEQMELLLAETRISLGDYRGGIDDLKPRLTAHAEASDYRRLVFLLAEMRYLLAGQSDADQRESLLAESEAAYLSLLEEGDDISLGSYLRLFDHYRNEGDEVTLLAFARRAESALAAEPAVLRAFYERIVTDAYSRGDIALTLEYLNRLGAFPAEERGFVAPYYQALLIADDNPRQALDIIEGYYREGGAVHPWLEFLRAERRYQLGEYNGSIELLASILDSAIDDDGLLSQATILLAHNRYALQDDEGALEALDVLGEYPTPASRSLRSRIYADRRQYAAAARELEALIGGEFWDSGRDLEYLQYLLSARQFGRLIDYYGGLENPGDGEDYVYALALIQSGGLQAGYEIFRNLVDGAGNSFRDEASQELYYYARYYLGWSAYRLSRDREAADAYRSLLESDFARELHGRAAYEGAWAAIQSGEYAEALAFIERLEAFDGDHPSAGSYALEGAYLRGKILRLLGRNEAAGRQFADFQRRNPRHPQADDALFDYARILISDGQIDRGIAVLDDFALSYPDSPISALAAFTRARAYYDAGEYREARNAFTRYRQSYRGAPDIDAALYYSALASRRLEEAGAAQLYLRGILDEHRDGFYAQPARYELATLLDERRNYRQALDAYRQYLEGSVADTTRRQILQRIGELERIVQGEDAEAATLWTTIEADPSLQRSATRRALGDLGRLIIISRGGVSSRMNDLLELLATMADSVDEHPSDAAGARYLLGRRFLQQALYREAAGSFLAAASADPRNGELASESLYFALEAYYTLGDQASAAAILVQMESSYPNSAWTSQARALMQRDSSPGGSQ
jgi:TolA-binding protein